MKEKKRALWLTDSENDLLRACLMFMRDNAGVNSDHVKYTVQLPLIHHSKEVIARVHDRLYAIQHAELKKIDTTKVKPIRGNDGNSSKPTAVSEQRNPVQERSQEVVKGTRLARRG